MTDDCWGTGNKAGTTLAQWLSQTKKEDPWTGFSVGEGSMMKADDEMLIAEEVEILDVVEDSESVQVKVGSTEDTK